MTRSVATLALFVLTVLAGAQPVQTLQARARIVPIDVVVTDKQGRPVKNLRASDFALTENRAPQTISHFEAHTSLSAEDAAKLPPMPKLDPNVFTDYSPAPAKSALNVLLLDRLNTPVQDQANLRAEIVKYLKSQPAGTRMAIFGLTDKLMLLQGFTSDPAILKAAIESDKNKPRTPANGAITGAEDPNEGVEDFLAAAMEVPRESVKLGDGPAQDDARKQATLEALNHLAHYLGGLPGRKNLIWFSGSFPISMTADIRPGSGVLYRETSSLLAQGQVAVYPIDARALMIDPNMDASHMDTASTKQYMIAGQAKADQQNLFQDIATELSRMNEIAADTGGKAIANTNGLADAVRQVVDAGSNYYTLTYSPTNRDADGDFRKVQVKLAKSGYALTYRPGYYAEDDTPTRKLEATKDDAPALEAAPNSARAALHAAMEYGSPQPSEIIFKAAINPATGQMEDVVAHGNSLSPKIQAPFERYVISVAALPADFTFTRSAAGKIHIGAQLVTCVYSSDGALLNAASIRIDNDIDDARYQSIMANGMKFEQQISVPAKGESFLRIGVEDLATSKMGVVEIPVATLAKLKPLAK